MAYEELEECEGEDEAGEELKIRRIEWEGEYLPESSWGLPCPDMEWTIGVCETLFRSVIETHFK